MSRERGGGLIGEQFTLIPVKTQNYSLRGNQLESLYKPRVKGVQQVIVWNPPLTGARAVIGIEHINPLRRSG